MQASLNAIRNRPRFKLYLNISRSEYAERLQKFLDRSEDLGGNINKEVATVWVKTEQQPFWKPHLTLQVEKDREKDSTVIRGVFGPSSAVWSFFVFLYALFGTAGSVFFALWFVTGRIGTSDFSWTKYAAIGCVLCIAALWAGAAIGQRQARKEMQVLRDFAERTTVPVEDPTISAE